MNRAVYVERLFGCFLFIMKHKTIRESVDYNRERERQQSLHDTAV